MTSISVFGMGKLGLPIAASLANKGYQVIGVDLNQNTIQAINEGKSPFYEPGLAELIKSARAHLLATDDYHYALQNSEISFILVATPSEPDGSFSTKYVESVAEGIATELKNKHSFHTVVLNSTVVPGATAGIVQPLLERVSGKKCGQDFGLCYSPEFMALGSVIRDFANPDVVLIGESDPKSGELLTGIHRNICENQPPIVRTTIYNAELAKIFNNAFITMKISFANTLAEFCERLPSGDAEAVSQALGFDSRIGRKCLLGALAYGGLCFPRDNKAFASFAKKIGCKARLAEATDEVNKDQTDRIIHIVQHRLGGVKGKHIAILGLTYKSNTDIIEESAAIKIANTLLQGGAILSVYDPAGMKNAQGILGEKGMGYAGSVNECLQGADFCILATPWTEFKSLKPEDFTTSMKQPVLLDCWRIFNRTEFEESLEYLAIGLGSEQKRKGGKEWNLA